MLEGLKEHAFLSVSLIEQCICHFFKVYFSVLFQTSACIIKSSLVLAYNDLRNHGHFLI